MNSQQITERIRQALPEAEVRVESDDNVHFNALVISQRFAGRRKLDCHREVYRALGDDMGEAIHALSLDTRVPENG